MVGNELRFGDGSEIQMTQAWKCGGGGSTWRTYTVGTYSPGKLSVVYEISIQVFPTVPSPTTTHLIGRPDDIFLL